MTTIDDFTGLLEGFVVALEGTIGRCPRCGRNGVLERSECLPPRCIHAEQTTLLCDGMLVEPTDCCQLPDA